MCFCKFIEYHEKEPIKAFTVLLGVSALTYYYNLNIINTGNIYVNSILTALLADAIVFSLN